MFAGVGEAERRVLDTLDNVVSEKEVLFWRRKTLFPPDICPPKWFRAPSFEIPGK